jgi:Icc-related predicted phosphoesterase
MPEGDVLVHAGDITISSETKVIEDFADYLSELPHTHKIVIAGNHDYIFEGSSKEQLVEMFKRKGITYLQDSSITIDGVKFYGSPWQPRFHDWGFNLSRGRALAEKWKLIPDDVNVLITHCPPFGILDRAPRGFDEYENVGCEELLKRIDELNKLQVHIFGHIHDCYGTQNIDGIVFANSCICNERYQAVNNPHIIEIESG